MSRTPAFIAMMIFVVGCHNVDLPPERPVNIPESSIWAGGMDGGHWFHCQSGIEKYVYDCEIYSDSDGAIRATGTYLLREVRWVAEEKRAIYSEVEDYSDISFDFFDGQVVHLKENLALVPDGVIDYPFGDGHGKRRTYEEGIMTGLEEEY